MPVVLLLAAILLTTAGCLGGSKNFATGAAEAGLGSSTSGLVGNPAPDFSLKSLDGSSVRLSELRGKPVIVNFWATWCPSCKEEMPVLQAAYEKYRDQGYEFLGVDLNEDGGTVQDFVQKGGYNWVFLLDTSGEVSTTYRVSGIPTTYFIDREGVIQEMFIGPVSKGILETKLDGIK